MTSILICFNCCFDCLYWLQNTFTPLLTNPSLRCMCDVAGSINSSPLFSIHHSRPRSRLLCPHHRVEPQLVSTKGPLTLNTPDSPEREGATSLGSLPWELLQLRSLDWIIGEFRLQPPLASLDAGWCWMLTSCLKVMTPPAPPGPG